MTISCLYGLVLGVSVLVHCEADVGFPFRLQLVVWAHRQDAHVHCQCRADANTP
jgi:hypothetical protein